MQFVYIIVRDSQQVALHANNNQLAFLCARCVCIKCVCVCARVRLKHIYYVHIRAKALLLGTQKRGNTFDWLSVALSEATNDTRRVVVI